MLGWGLNTCACLNARAQTHPPTRTHARTHTHTHTEEKNTYTHSHSAWCLLERIHRVRHERVRPQVAPVRSGIAVVAEYVGEVRGGVSHDDLHGKLHVSQDLGLELQRRHAAEICSA